MASYHVNQRFSSDIFVLPCRAADDLLKELDLVSLRSLIYIFRCSPRSVTLEELSNRTGFSAGETESACEKLASLQLIYREETEQQPASSRPSSEKRRRLIKPYEIAEMAENDSELVRLVNEAQQIIGKPISPVQSEVLTSLYSYYGLTSDYILLALHYTVEKGNFSIRYFEKMVASWVDSGISDFDALDDHLKHLREQDDISRKIKLILGIRGRNLTEKEMSYAKKWTDTYRSSPELIKLSYDTTVDNTGKISFPYMDKILQSWHELGITTAEQAKSASVKRKNRNAPSSFSGNDSYIDELEKMINRRYTDKG